MFNLITLCVIKSLTICCGIGPRSSGTTGNYYLNTVETALKGSKWCCCVKLNFATITTSTKTYLRMLTWIIVVQCLLWVWNLPELDLPTLFCSRDNVRIKTITTNYTLVRWGVSGNPKLNERKYSSEVSIRTG